MHPRFAWPCHTRRGYNAGVSDRGQMYGAADIDLSVHIVEPSAKPRARTADDVAAMAVAVQANLVTLKVADARRQEIDPARHDLPVPAPGPVLRFRETLLDREAVRHYSDVERRLRLHEIWGQFCLLSWLFGVDDPRHPPDFARCSQTHTLRCGAVLAIKTAEIEATLWRMHFEQRDRHDPTYRQSADYAVDSSVAIRIPAKVFGRRVQYASDDDLLVCGCEHAGMLAAIRWASDDRRVWGAPGIMDVGGRPEVA